MKVSIAGIVINDIATCVEIILVINWESAPNCFANESDEAAVGTEAKITATVISNCPRPIKLATMKADIGSTINLSEFDITIGMICKVRSRTFILAPGALGTGYQDTPQGSA